MWQCALIEQGIGLAERVDSLLREACSDLITEETGFEQFAQPNVEPFGLASTSLFFFSGCQTVDWALHSKRILRRLLLNLLDPA
jgi:hypothetical protein